VQHIEREQAAEYLDRWASVARQEREELQGTSLEVKLRQLGALLASCHLFPPLDADDRGEDDVRQRWNKIRDALRERSAA
jgi:hypothetical protein